MAKKFVRPSKMSIDERIFIKAKGETTSIVFNRILVELKKFDFYGRFDLISEVARHPRLPIEFLPVFNSGRVFHGVINTGGWISRNSYIHWLIGIFARLQGLLKSFLELRARVNTQVLKGEGNQALETLAIAAKLTESWWGIELGIHINRELLGSDTKGYIKQLPEAHPNVNIAGKTRDLLILSETASASVYVETVLGRIKEYKSTAFDLAIEHGAAESCQLLPVYFDSGRQPTLDALEGFRTWSIFDQYVLFRGIIGEMHLRGELEPQWVAASTALATAINDWELKNILLPENDDDLLMQSVVDSYTHGDYRRVVETVSAAVSDENPRTFALLEIYARAKIYNACVGTGTTFYDKLSDEIAKILTLDSKSPERAEFLRKISIKFRDAPWSKSLLYHLVAIQQSGGDSEAVERLRLQTYCLGNFNTPKVRNRDYQLSPPLTLVQSSVPQYRALRYADIVSDNPVLDVFVFPIYSDYLKTQALLYLKNGQVSNAMNFCIDEYLKNKFAFDFLPIRRLCEAVSEIERTDKSDFVSSLIVLDIYGRVRDNIFDDLKTEIFEEFLYHENIFEPSKIFAVEEVDEKVGYFLRNICVPSQLDNIIQFSNYDEVIHERVAIIDLLIASRSGNADYLRKERDKVLETLFAEKLRAKIETGKLYVDVQALEMHRRHIYISLFDQAKSLEGGVRLDPLSDEDGSIDSSDLFQINNDSSWAVASSEKTNILLRIFLQAVQDFALNENYGLDKYLSAEVRHIVFVTQLRSCFERSELVTVQKDGLYLSNQYWIQKYNYLPSGMVGDLDNILSRFSQEVDSILSKVNDRFRVKVADLESDNIFDFCPYHDRIVRVSEIVNNSSSFDEFFGALIAFMWQLAVESARAAQQLINDDLLDEVTDAIDRLELSVQSLKGNLGMVDLMQAIRNVRSDFKKDVELVLNWFRFVGSDELQTFERLGIVVEAAVSSYDSMFKHKRKALSFSQQKSNLILSYSEARALFISLFTALENALRYGAEDTPVMIMHEVVERFDRIVITNVIRAEKFDSDSANFVRQIKAKWTHEYSGLSTAEGGSGLYKIHNLLSNASGGFGFDISVVASDFNATIELNHEYFNNRG